MNFLSEREIRNRRLAEITKPWYRVPVPADYTVEEYHPRGRFLDLSDDSASDEDFYHRNGVPHEVSVRNNPGEYIPFKKFMMTIARAWARRIPTPQPNPELFGDDHGSVRINFFRVIKARIAKNKSFAFWSRLSVVRQESALSQVWQPMPNMQDHALHARVEAIAFSLTNIEFERTDIEPLKRYINSPAVRIAFDEYFEDYLQWNLATANPQVC